METPWIRNRISAPAGERPSGAEGNERVCMENLRVVPALSRTDASTARTSAHEGIPKAA
jgi:hypothetical protein